MKPLGKGIIVATVLLILILPTFLKFRPKVDQADTQPALEEESDEIIIVMDPGEVMITMYDQRQKELIELPLEEYLIGVVAGEMPAGFDSEALKAQAVAARTLVIAKMPLFGGRGCNQKQGADVCSSFAHCQEWISEDMMHKNWGENFDANYAKVKKAVADTHGEIMTYKGRPIEVLYHSTSNGMTEEAGEVFSQSLPYYTAVKSEGDENGPMFEGSLTLSNQRFVDIFKDRYNISLHPDKLDKEIKIKGYTDSGRIRDLIVGGKVIKATEFRLLYGLNSTDITFVFGKDTITMKTRGFGHGVGMSQVGADQMARNGYNYKDILYHYYRGVDINRY